MAKTYQVIIRSSLDTKGLKTAEKDSASTFDRIAQKAEQAAKRETQAHERMAREVQRINAQTARQVEQQSRIQERAAKSLADEKQRLIRREQEAFLRAESEKTKAAQAAARAQVKAAEQSTARMQALWAGLKTTALAVFAGIVAAGAGLGLAISKAMSMDALERGLAVVAGGAERAGEQLKRLREIARQPGIGFREAVEGAIALQVAFKTVFTDINQRAQISEKILSEVANAVAVSGKGKAEFDRVIIQMSQMASAGKVLTADLRPILQAAPAIGEALIKAFGTINAGDIEKLGLSSKEFFERLIVGLQSINRATPSAANAWDNFTDSLDRALITIGRPFLEPLRKGLDALEPLLNSLADRVAEIFTKLGTDAATLWVNLPASTKAAFESMWATVQGLGNQIVGWFTKNYPLILSVVTNILNQIAAFWRSHGGEINAIVSSSLQSVLDTATMILKILEGNWRGAWDQLSKIIRSQGTAIQASIVFVVRLAFEAVVAQKDLIKKAGMSLGEALVDGMIAGMKSKWSPLRKTIEAIMNPAVALAHDLVEAKSPSRVFMRLGADIGEGLIIGIRSKGAGVQQTLADLLDVTAGKFTKAPKKPAEAAAKQIAKILREQAEALREIGGKESAVDRMNRLLSDKSVTKLIDDRTRAILRMSAAIEDAKGATRERSAVLTRPRVVNELDWLRLGSTRDREVEKGDPHNEMIRQRTIGDPVAIQLGQAYADVIDDLNVKLRHHADLSQVEITLQRLQEAGLGDLTDARAQEAIGIAQQIDQQSELLKMRENVRDAAEDIASVFARATEQWSGSFGKFFKSIGQGFGDLIKNMIAKVVYNKLANVFENFLGSLLMPKGATTSGGGFGGILKSLTGGFAGGPGGGGFMGAPASISAAQSTWGSFKLPGIDASSGPGASGGGLNKILQSLGLGGGGTGTASGAGGLASAGAMAGVAYGAATWLGILSGQKVSGFQALTGGGILGFFVNRMLTRRREEKERTVFAGDALTQVYQILWAVQRGELNASGARSKYDEIRTAYMVQANTLRDSKTRNHAILWWNDVDRDVWPKIEAASKDAEKRQNDLKRMSPVFARGGINQMNQLIRVTPGEGFRNPGSNMVSVIPGKFTGQEDQSFMFAPKGAEIIPRSRMSGARGFANGTDMPSLTIESIEVYYDADNIARAVVKTKHFKDATVRNVKLGRLEKKI